VSARSVTTKSNFQRLCFGAVSISLVALPAATAVAVAPAAAPALVSTRSGDPIAQAALAALDSLERGGVGVPPAVPPSDSAGLPLIDQLPTSTLATVASAFSAEFQVSPPVTAPIVWTESAGGWKSAVVETDSLRATTVPISTIPVSAVSNKKAKTVATTTVPGVRMLPASTVPGPAVVPVAADGSTAVSAPQAPLAVDVARRNLAVLVSARVGMAASAVNLESVWATSEVKRVKAVYSALAQVGTPYRYSGNEPGGFDCSGLTSFAWAAAGVRLPRTSTDQINAASPRGADRLLPGDLVWRPGHVMMYVGIAQLVVDSPQTGKSVMVRSWGRTSRYGSPI
jgi:peptidoglycan DL-endopeptidase CwlO